MEGLEYNRTVILDDDLARIELETLQDVTSIHLVPKKFTSSSVKQIKDIFGAIREELRQSGILEIINLIDPDSKLHKLHLMFGFEKVGQWRNHDVYWIPC